MRTNEPEPKMPTFRSRVWGRAPFALGVLTLVIVLSGSAAPAFAVGYVALGDSLAVGVGDNVEGGYVERYRDAAANDLDTAVVLQNLAVGGSTSADLLATLTVDASVRNAVSTADIVTFDIGGNDILIALFAFAGGTCGGTDGQDCLRQALDGFVQNWSLILAELRALNPGAMIRTMTYYNPFVVDLTPGDGTAVAWKPYFVELNKTIRTSASAFGIAVADAALAFNGSKGTKDPIEAGYIDPDHIHPSPSGHALLADLFRGLGYVPAPGTFVRIPSSLRFRDDVEAPIDPLRRKLSFKASTRRDQAPGARIVLPHAGGPQDPRTAGAALTLYNGAGLTGDHAVVSLDASGWTLEGANRFRFTGAGPVEQVLVRPDLIKVKGGAGLGYTLDEPVQGAIALRLSFGGGGAWCASSGARSAGSPPSTAKNDLPGKFVGQKNAQAPANCPPDRSLGTTTTTTTTVTTTTSTTTTTAASLPSCGGPLCGGCGSCGDGFCMVAVPSGGCRHVDSGNVCISNSQCSLSACSFDSDCPVGRACISTGSLTFCCAACP
jgi:lysophospholipase L1-like esterase